MGRRVEDLSKSVTDLIVNMKSVTFGVPPINEVTISERALTTAELKRMINYSFGDPSIGMLAQVRVDR